MDKLDAMNAFTKVVSLGNYAEAGRHLGLTRSAVSKAVIELEELLGIRLLDRTTRQVHPTEVGRTYYERCVDILASVEETELQVSRLHDQPKGVLKLNGPMSFGSLYLADAVAEFMEAHNGLKVEFTLNDRYINPVEEGFDVTVRIGTLDDSSLIARKLTTARHVLAASPEYLAKYGHPQTPDDLVAHRCLNYGYTTTMNRWQLIQDGQLIAFPINSALCTNNGDVLRIAALCGNGITNLPTFLIGPDIKAGKLALVLPNHPPATRGIYVLYAPNRYLAAKVRVFVDFLAAKFGSKPEWDEF